MVISGSATFCLLKKHKKKLKDLHLVEYNIYIYINTNIDRYIYNISIPTHIYIYIYNIYTCTSVIIRILFAIIDFTDWMGNARGGLAAHSAGASQSCGNGTLGRRPVELGNVNYGTRVKQGET